LRQTPDAQSVETTHSRPSAQGGHVPPQSTSVSVPFMELFAHEPFRQNPSMQRAPVSQSAVIRHFFPLVHTTQVPPPQSVSVSAPFSAPSPHVGDVHTDAVHKLDVQSVPATHEEPGKQRAQLPPQSRSVSLPFWSASAHAGF
jgi:hypothetical protein